MNLQDLLIHANVTLYSYNLWLGLQSVWWCIFWPMGGNWRIQANHTAHWPIEPAILRYNEKQIFCNYSDRTPVSTADTRASKTPLLTSSQYKFNSSSNALGKKNRLTQLYTDKNMYVAMQSSHFETRRVVVLVLQHLTTFFFSSVSYLKHSGSFDEVTITGLV